MEKGLKKEGAAAIKGSQGTALGSGSGSSCSCNGHFAGCWPAGPVAVGSFAHQLSSPQLSTQFNTLRACLPISPNIRRASILTTRSQLPWPSFPNPRLLLSKNRNKNKINPRLPETDRHRVGGVVPCFYSTSLGSVSFPANAKLAGSARAHGTAQRIPAVTERPCRDGEEASGGRECSVPRARLRARVGPLQRLLLRPAAPPLPLPGPSHL